MKKVIYYVNSENRGSVFELSNNLLKLINNIDKDYEKIAFICIGTDRSTGDSYGPFVGHMLSKIKFHDFDLYGTLENPVHALNLKETLNKIDIEKTLVIGIDACLGKLENIGHIMVGNHGLKPGNAVGKDLPLVGDIHIAGIVNAYGFMPMMVLQNTRLNTVYKMAQITSSAIRLTLYKRKIHETKFNTNNSLIKICN